MQTKSVYASLAVLCLLASLSGCTGDTEDNDLTLQLRTDFLSCEDYSGTMELTADYGQRVYAYTVTFTASEKEGLQMVITEPEEVAGISAHVLKGQTSLEYDGINLETGPLDADGLSPLDALPALFAAMRSGYIAETGNDLLGDVNALRILCREPEQTPGQGLETILWFDKETKTLLQGEIRSNGFTVIRSVFSDFTMQQAKE